MSSSAASSGSTSSASVPGSASAQAQSGATTGSATGAPPPSGSPPPVSIPLGPAGSSGQSGQGSSSSASVFGAPDLNPQIIALNKLGKAGQAAVERIKHVQQNPASFPAYSLHSYIDPVGVEMALEHEKTQGSGFQGIGIFRNMLILVPLFFTWLGLSLATNAYQNDIKAHPTDVNYPFLVLWQQGFGVQHPLLGPLGTFTAFALVDSILFLSMILLGLWLDSTNGLARRKGEQARELLDSCVQALTAYSISVGGNINAQTDPGQWAAFVHQRLQETAATLNQVSNEIRSLQQTAATLGTQATGLGTQAANLGTRANELGVEAGKLTGAVNQIQGSATAMATAATGMTAAAGAMATSSQGVSAATASMVTAQNQFTTRMDTAINGMATRTEAAANTMATRTETAVRGMTTAQDRATQALDRFTQQYTTTANNVAAASTNISNTMRGLDQRLDQTRRAMDNAADQVVKAAALVRRIQRGGGGFFDWLFRRTPSPTQPNPQQPNPQQPNPQSPGGNQYYDPNAQAPQGFPNPSRQGHQGQASTQPGQMPGQPGQPQQPGQPI